MAAMGESPWWGAQMGVQGADYWRAVQAYGLWGAVGARIAARGCLSLLYVIGTC
jgi:hypothetical protein